MVLYPDIEPYHTGFIQLSDIHTMYYEEAGNPQGIPALFVHGGPGGCSSAGNRRYFDPEKYRIIQFDQRGAGKSTPFASTQDNTTQHLIADMEVLRNHLDVETWVVVGTSWGVCLSLVYAQAYPERVMVLLEDGVFLATQTELDWLHSTDGAARIYPEAFEKFINLVPEAERDNPVQAYAKLFESADADVRKAAIREWTAYECRLMSFNLADAEIEAELESPTLEAHSRFENYYLRHKCFLKDEQVFADMAKIAHIPLYIVQGRQDMVCPPATAYRLHKAHPKSELCMIANSGHLCSDEARAKIREILDNFLI